jgi:hypothetical protein
VNDERIGLRNMPEGKITRYPSRFVTGAPLNRKANPSATMQFFGKDKNYFVVLPINVPFTPSDIRAELYTIIGEEDQQLVREAAKLAKELASKVVENKEEEAVIEVVPSNKKKESLVNPVSVQSTQTEGKG